MANDKKIPPILHTALNLDGSSRSIKKFYADWAETYDRDTADIKYTAVNNVIKILQDCPSPTSFSVDPTDRTIKIMDAGCGTGLLGKNLHTLGYRNIDGFDISEDMVNIAGDLGIYRNLYPNIDINQAVNDEWVDYYDCTVSIGVFTSGHVPPEALSQLAKMTRSGGMIIVSTRVAYYKDENYQQVSDRMESDGLVKLVYSVKNATYTDDSKAHYWVYASLNC